MFPDSFSMNERVPTKKDRMSDPERVEGSRGAASHGERCPIGPAEGRDARPDRIGGAWKHTRPPRERLANAGT